MVNDPLFGETTPLVKISTQFPSGLPPVVLICPMLQEPLPWLTSQPELVLKLTPFVLPKAAGIAIARGMAVSASFAVLAARKRFARSIEVIDSLRGQRLSADVSFILNESQYVFNSPKTNPYWKY
jgi:hypothetical protein